VTTPVTIFDKAENPETLAGENFDYCYYYF